MRTLIQQAAAWKESLQKHNIKVLNNGQGIVLFYPNGKSKEISYEDALTLIKQQKHKNNEYSS